MDYNEFLFNWYIEHIARETGSETFHRIIQILQGSGTAVTFIEAAATYFGTEQVDSIF